LLSDEESRKKVLEALAENDNMLTKFLTLAVKEKEKQKDDGESCKP
jgi:hypothetical protein